MRGIAWVFLIVVACGGPKVVTTHDGDSEKQAIPGVTTPDPIRGQFSNAPLKPLASTAPYDSPVKTCNKDSDCTGSFNHCLKDVPDEVGICTKECGDTSECGSDANWLCTSAIWSLDSSEERFVCGLACTLNIECPRGTSCGSNHFCGTPCSGNNCGAAQECEHHAYVECVGDAVYYFSDCAEPEEVKQVCGSGEVCAFGQCLKGDVVVPGGSSGGGGSCAGTVRRCASSSTISIEDGCGNVVGTDNCTGGKVCTGGSCDCGPSSQKRCVSGKLWSLDSCGNRVAIVGSCNN